MKIINIDDKEYPDRLRKIPSAPKEIYVLGNTSILNENGLAMVGSRNCTLYGKSMAEKFARELTLNGLNIISGMALGIDTYSHRSCLDVNGKTIAVLGSGFNNIYPEQNENLFSEIIEKGGAIVSEYPPNVKVCSEGFRRRNRIVCGLSIATLIVEAAINSGTMITARYTKEQEKLVFCVPSNLDSLHGKGTNELLRKGAKIATCVEDILDELKLSHYIINLDKISMKHEKVINDEYKEIYNLLKNEIRLNPNEICKKINKTISDVSTKLLFMEMDGLVKKEAGNFYEIIGD